jgi:hypothetical protein
VRIIADLCLTSLAAITLSACSIDKMRADLEAAPALMDEALNQQKLALENGCLAAVFDGKPLADLMAATPNAKSVPVSQTGSPAATAAWKIGNSNQTYVMQLPNGACSASVTLGDPQRLYDEAIALAQKRATFRKGKVDTSERGDAERTSFCSEGAYPYVFVIYKRTTGSRGAFLVNVFKAQGAQFSACTP